MPPARDPLRGGAIPCALVCCEVPLTSHQSTRNAARGALLRSLLSSIPSAALSIHRRSSAGRPCPVLAWPNEVRLAPLPAAGTCRVGMRLTVSHVFCIAGEGHGQPLVQAPGHTRPRCLEPGALPLLTAVCCHVKCVPCCVLLATCRLLPACRLPPSTCLPPASCLLSTVLVPRRGACRSRC